MLGASLSLSVINSEDTSEDNKENISPLKHETKSPNIEERAVISKKKAIFQLVHLRNTIDIRILDSYARSSEPEFNQKRLTVELQHKKDKISLCINTEGMYESLVAMSMRYHIVESLDHRNGNEGVHIFCSKIVANQWEVDFLSDVSKHFESVICEFVTNQIKQLGLPIFSGSSRTCLGLSRKIKGCSISRIPFGTGLAFLFENIANSLDLIRELCEYKRNHEIKVNDQFYSRILSLADIKRANDVTSNRDIHLESTQKNKVIMPVTTILTFQQREVSCLIGCKGHRLDFIRESTKCCIKVQSIDSGSGVSISLPRNSVPQSVSVTGQPKNVQQAVQHIQYYIKRFRESGSKFI
ncbi:uncharacterized protein PRCAT00005174001 [Priceomyces carsonii]|uniref:uncharacterized protein n=1 Tax=Priceomyces carsonii TaxID=28549 RepID=UPI002ED9B364|nr:unnamed protein product [Priceomyces carsonii]